MKKIAIALMLLVMFSLGCDRYIGKQNLENITPLHGKDEWLYCQEFEAGSKLVAIEG